jgi:hypothetical protein
LAWSKPAPLRAFPEKAARSFDSARFNATGIGGLPLALLRMTELCRMTGLFRMTELFIE